MDGLWNHGPLGLDMQNLLECGVPTVDKKGVISKDNVSFKDPFSLSFNVHW